ARTMPSTASTVRVLNRTTRSGTAGCSGTTGGSIAARSDDALSRDTAGHSLVRYARLDREQSRWGRRWDGVTRIEIGRRARRDHPYSRAPADPSPAEDPAARATACHAGLGGSLGLLRLERVLLPRRRARADQLCAARDPRAAHL